MLLSTDDEEGTGSPGHQRSPKQTESPGKQNGYKVSTSQLSKSQENVESRPVGQRAVDIMSAAVNEAVEDQPDFQFLINAQQPPIFALLDALTNSGDIPDILAADVLNRLSESAPRLSNACLSSPANFMQVMAVLTPILAGLPENTNTFAMASQAFALIGRSLVDSDPHTSFTLFSDFALPSLLPVLKDRPASRHALLRLVYAFTRPDIPSRASTIRVLQERLGNMATFIHCLAVLIQIEPDFDDQLLDLYS